MMFFRRLNVTRPLVDDGRSVYQNGYSGFTMNLDKTVRVYDGSIQSSGYSVISSLTGVYITAESVIAVLATVGNFLVCLAVTRNRKLRTVTNYFLVSLAVADIFVGMLAIPCAVVTDLGMPHHNLPLCLVLLSVLIVLTQSSILSLLAVAMERYVAILLPFQYQRIISPRNARLALILTWCLALLSGSIPLMGWHGSLPPSGACWFSSVVDMSYMVYFNFLGCVLTPLVVMFIIYGHIFLTVRQQLRRIAAGRGLARPDTQEDQSTAGSIDDGSGTIDCVAVPEKRVVVVAWDVAAPAETQAQHGEGVDGKREECDNKDLSGCKKKSGDREGASGSGGTGSGSEVTNDPRSCSKWAGTIRVGSKRTGKPRSGFVAGDYKRTLRMRREVRKATSLFLLLFLFMTCWLPIHVVNCVALLRPQWHVPKPLSLAAILLSHANSALNPLLYAYRMRSFRHTLRNICCTRSS